MTAQVVPFPRPAGGSAKKGLRELRIERGWSLNGVAKAMMAAATDDEKKSLPDSEGLKRNWVRWEKGTVLPDGNRSEPFFRPIIARMFDVTPDDLFPSLSPRTSPVGVDAMRSELQARHNQIRKEISRLEAELAYLNAVLAIPVPANSL